MGVGGKGGLGLTSVSVKALPYAMYLKLITDLSRPSSKRGAMMSTVNRAQYGQSDSPNNVTLTSESPTLSVRS